MMRARACGRRPSDSRQRHWPRAARAKSRYFSMTVSAAEGLLRYLDCPIPGLWYDRIDARWATRR